MVERWGNERKTGLVALITVFFLIQFAIDLAHSVTAFPFVHYGMFSAPFSAPDSLLSYEVTIDGKKLEPAAFRIYRWDMIQGPLAAFDKQVRTDDFAFDKEKIRAALPGIYSAISSNLDNSPNLPGGFPDWYHDYLCRLLGQPIRTLLVNRTWYRYRDGATTLLNSTPWIDRE